MKSLPEHFLGIDPTAGRNPYTWAVLDADCQLTALGGGDLETLLDLVDGCNPALAAVNAPPRPNLGLVRRKLAAAQASTHLRGVDMRLAEYELRERGISVPPTGSRPESCAAWTQMGFEIHRQLEGRGFALHPDQEARCQRFETNPHAVFCALLGQVPLPKPALEGRLQRQLALHAEGAGINDPMDFFEEITRHKLLRGLLPLEFLYAADELDALAAAFTAWCAANRPDSWLAVGEREEGQIVLPVKELKDKYN